MGLSSEGDAEGDRMDLLDFEIEVRNVTRCDTTDEAASSCICLDLDLLGEAVSMRERVTEGGTNLG